MSAKHGISLFCGALIYFVASPGTAQPLAETLKQAYAHSLEIAQERQKLRATKAQVGRAIAGAEPTITVDAEESRGKDVVTGGTPLENSLLRSSVPRSSYDVVLDQPLFRSGRTPAEVSGAIDSVRAAAFKLSAAEQDALLQAAKDYVDLLRDRNDAVEARKSADLAATILKGVQERLGKQDASQFDILTAQATWEEAAADADNAQSKLIDTEQQFERDVGAPASNLSIPILPAILPASEAEAISLTNGNPEIQYAEFSARASKEDVRVARSAGRPSVELEATIRDHQGAVFAQEREQVRSVSFKLHVPVFSGGLVRAQVEEKEALFAGAEDAIAIARADNEMKARTAFRQMHVFDAVWQRYHASVQSRQDLVTGEGRLFALGEASKEDVLTAQRNLVEAERNENRAMHDRLITQFNLIRAIGHMTLDQFGVDTDDPDLSISARKLILDGISVPFVR
ncbi:TolC family protein [Sphingobium sp. Sx8-8]|uniref:TolC family protein n=1 Tax=Sphingobium sp. Sx8-8 TaxID=2933617 RepID=UPI001F59BE8A|nr:TolC family protein [Sphingobium sp. Sx8-8]